MSLPPTGNGTQVLLTGFVPAPCLQNCIGINMASPRFLNWVHAQKGKHHGPLRKPKGWRVAHVYFSRVFWNLSVSPFCAERVVCAEILILFHYSTLDQKSKRAFPGKFHKRSSHASGRLKVKGWLWVDCTSIPNSPRSNVTSFFNFSGMTRSMSSFACPHSFL